MQISDLVTLVNKHLADEMLSYTELRPFLDRTIDDINSALNTIYPAFSELPPFTPKYDAFPDRYLRTVVATGAAWYYYVNDEEGSPAAMQYQILYNKELFLMQRDMLYNIPEEYKADSLQGTVQFEFTGERGIELPYGIGEW